LARVRSLERLGRILLALVLFLSAVLHFAWSEAVIFFGHPLRGEDLQTNLHPRLFLGSAQGTVLATFLAVIAIYWAAVAVVQWTSRRARFSVVSGGRLLAVAVAAALIAQLPLKAHLIETTRNPVVAILALMKENPWGQIRGEIEIPKPSYPLTAIRELAPRRRQFLDDAYPLAHVAPPRSPEALRLQRNGRPNIVFFLMEGIRDEEVGAYGGSLKNLTPNIDRLAREGIMIDDVYSVGSYTPEGELGVWYGLLASPYEIIIRTRPDVAVSGLPEILKANGWKSFVWVHPGDQTLYLSSRFYLHHGFRMLDGRDFAPSEPHTNWGYSDKALGRRGLEALDKTREPFAAMLLTVTNHHPFQLPSDASGAYRGLPEEKRGWVPVPGSEQLFGLHTVPMLKTVHYTDEALGYFMDEARKRPWFDNTIFVILGDHGLPITPLSGIASLHHFAGLRHRVPLIFYSPLLAGGKVIEGPASHADILPTLLGLFGVTSPRAGVGIDLFDPADRDPERPIVAVSPDARLISVVTATRAYHARFAPPTSGHIATFNEEFLIDPIADPRGLNNLVDQGDPALDRLRRAAKIYLEVYPWLLAEGRTGVPDEAIGNRQ
ncbi:MAG TPA: LTA synthase family protein, partial [Thermoanaerobaculia bacterium]